MFPYIPPLIISLICAIVYDINGKTYGKKFFWLFLFVYMTLFMGLRYGVGGDTNIYMNMFDWVPNISNYTLISANRFDPGFNLLQSVGKTIYPEFVGFQFIHTLLFNSLLFIVISRYSDYRFSVFFCSLFVFYYYFSTEILRESLAVIIFVYFYNYYEQKKWLRFFLVVLLCSLMHRGALFLLFIPFLRGIKINKYFPFILVVTLFIGMGIKYILNYLNNVVFIADDTLRYQSDTTHGFLADILTILRLSGFPLLISFLVKKERRYIEFKFENMNTILILFGILSFFNPIIFSRLCNYFIIFFTITIGTYLSVILKKGSIVARQNAIILSVTFLMLYGSSFIMYRYYTRLVPYYSIFNPTLVDRDNFK